MTGTIERMMNLVGGGDSNESKLRQAKFHTVFTTGVGPDALAMLLEQLGFFGKIDPADPEGVARHNVAIEILEFLGVIVADKGQPAKNVRSLVTRMLSERVKQ